MRLVCFSLRKYDLSKRLIQHNHRFPQIPENLQSVRQQIIDLPGVILRKRNMIDAERSGIQSALEILWIVQHQKEQRIEKDRVKPLIVQAGKGLRGIIHVAGK